MVKGGTLKWSCTSTSPDVTLKSWRASLVKDVRAASALRRATPEL